LPREATKSTALREWTYKLKQELKKFCRVVTVCHNAAFYCGLTANTPRTMIEDGGWKIEDRGLSAKDSVAILDPQSSILVLGVLAVSADRRKYAAPARRRRSRRSRF